MNGITTHFNQQDSGPPTPLTGPASQSNMYSLEQFKGGGGPIMIQCPHCNELHEDDVTQCPATGKEISLDDGLMLLGDEVDVPILPEVGSEDTTGTELAEEEPAGTEPLSIELETTDEQTPTEDPPTVSPTPSMPFELALEMPDTEEPTKEETEPALEQPPTPSAEPMPPEPAEISVDSTPVEEPSIETPSAPVSEPTPPEPPATPPLDLSSVIAAATQVAQDPALEDATPTPDEEAATATPRWVTVLFAITVVAMVAVTAFAVFKRIG